MSSAEFTLNVNALGVLEDRLEPLAEAAARLLVNALKAEMEEAPPRTGRVYLVPGTKTPYTASAPGEPPAVREGRYRDAWTPTKAFRTARGVAAAATNAVMAGDEPLGLHLDEHMNRPHLREGMRRAEPEIRALVQRAQVRGP